MKSSSRFQVEEEQVGEGEGDDGPRPSENAEEDNSKIVVTVQTMVAPTNLSMMSGQNMSSGELQNQLHTTNEHRKLTH